MPSARKSAPPKAQAKAKRTAVPHGPSEGKGKPAASKAPAKATTAPAMKSAARTKRGGAAASGVVTCALLTRLLMRKLAALQQLARLLTSRTSTGNGIAGRELLLGQMLLVLEDSAAAPIQHAAALAAINMIDGRISAVLPPTLLGPALDRDAPEVRAWRTAVLKRDGNACTRCGSAHKLHAHHLNRWSTTPHLRIVVDNGITLCQPCHAEEHSRAA